MTDLKRITRAEYNRLRAIRKRADELEREITKLEVEAATITGDTSQHRDATVDYVCNGRSLPHYLKVLGVTVGKK